VAHFNLAGPDYYVYVVRSKKRDTQPVYEPLYLTSNLGVQLRNYIMGNRYEPRDTVFGQLQGGRDSRKISQRGLRFVFAKAGVASIGRSVNCKEFRSLFVQQMVDSGVPMAMAAKMVGHEDRRTTQKHYYELTRDRRRIIGQGIQV